MNDLGDLIAKAGAVLGDGDPVLAAGIFALKDDYLRVGVGGAAGAGAGDAIFGNPLATAVGGAAAMHATRSAVAASQGLTVRMLVAVTPRRIRLLDWITGSGPTKVLASFDRHATTVTVTKFGLSRHVELADAASGRSLALTGSTAPFVSESRGDKAVLRILSAAV